MFSLFHYIGLAVLVAGEVRAYRFRGQLPRALGVPLAYWLLPGFAKQVFMFVDKTPTLLGLQDLVAVAWVLIGVAWGGWQLLKYRTRRAGAAITEPSHEEESASETSPGDRPLSANAVASLCLGVSALLAFISGVVAFTFEPLLMFFIWGPAPILIIAGVACGRLGRVDIQAGKRRGARLARTGEALSYATAIALVVGTIWFLSWIAEGIAGI